MDRIEKSEKTLKELFGGSSAANSPDPDFQDIMTRFTYGEVYHLGKLEHNIRHLIILAVLTVNQTLPQLKEHTSAALKIGVSPLQIKETLYQCAPYIGFPKVQNALTEINAVFEQQNIAIPVETSPKTQESQRIEKGLEAQVHIFGDAIHTMQENAPESQKHIQQYLSAFCFGDFYTREGLDLKTRELLTLCIVSALGGCESQVRSHINGNLNIGNDEEILIAAITQCLPIIGFPRTLNALACINEITKRRNRS